MNVTDAPPVQDSQANTFWLHDSNPNYLHFYSYNSQLLNFVKKCAKIVKNINNHNKSVIYF